MKVIMVGPDPLNKGGIATLERNILASAKDPAYEYTMHVARPEGSKLKKFFLVPLYTLYFLIRILVKKYDIVHIHISENWGFFRYVPFVYLGRMAGLGIIIHPNACEFDSFYERQGKSLKKLIRSTLNKSNCIITVSNEWAEVFRSISTTRVEVVYNFVDLPEVCDYKNTSKILTTSGQLEKRKGYYDLVKVIPELIRFDPELSFKFCGNGEIGVIYSELKKLSMDSHVELTGWLLNDDVKKILRQSLLFVLPTYNEGMPLAILEAMSFGLPVISTTAGGIPSLVKDGINGILVEPGDLEALKKAVIKLLSDADLRSEMSNNNYQKIKKDFSATSNMQKLYRIYTEVITKKQEDC
ncbi:MAG: glycosyltransferase family 4 protein [Bacteroidetes bacterium]|nr:glycosyltransferase family 4 protein [Bacteroidota bacterium]